VDPPQPWAEKPAVIVTAKGQNWPSWPRRCRGKQAIKRVDHRVAHEARPVRGDSLVAQVASGVATGREQQVGRMIDDDSVVLLRHEAIMTPQAGLEMRHRNVELHACERHGHAGVHIPGHQHDVGLKLQQRLDALQDTCGLHSVRA